MSGRQQLERIMEIDRQVRSGRYPNALRLAKILEVRERTIYQDRQFLIDRLGAPLAYDSGHGGWCYTDDTYILPSMMVTEGELLAFFLSVEAARRCLGTSFEPSLRSAMDKISRGLKAPVEVTLEEIRECYIFATLPTVSVREELLLSLHRATKERRQVQIYYYTASRDCWQERVVEPYHLYNRNGDWYLIAFDHPRSDFCIFHTGRIDRWEIMNSIFERDSNFHLGDWMAQAFQMERGEQPVEVAVRFDAYQAPYIRERRWHPTQQVEELPNGGLMLRLQVGSLDEVKRWVLSYGSHATVLAPPGLREEVATEACSMAALYDKASTIMAAR
ncbi:MAG: WYL domain-containing protein [Thermacetogeniaceae bacterium]